MIHNVEPQFGFINTYCPNFAENATFIGSWNLSLSYVILIELEKEERGQIDIFYTSVALKTLHFLQNLLLVFVEFSLSGFFVVFNY